MGARDLSIINTPPNRQPVTTQVSCFEEEVVRDAILFEIPEEDRSILFIIESKTLKKLLD